MTQILLVDDDEVFRPALQKTLETLGFQVLSARHGLEATAIILKMQVDVIISDIRMPEMDGVALTKFVKATRPTPVVLMTGFADIIETHEAYQLGADEFLAKPFERDDLMKAIKRCLNPVADPNAGQEEESYCKLALEDFMSGRQVLFSIYIRLAEDKFVRIANKGEDLTSDQINSYRKKGVSFLYLRQEDFRTYVGFNLELGRAAAKSQVVSRSKKLNLLRHTGEILLQEIRREGGDPELFGGAAAFVETAVDILTDDPDVFELLEALNRHTDYLYAHAVGVSLYGVLIAQKVEWTLPTTKFKVAAGGLLHDVGQKEIEVDLLMRPRAQWSVEELKRYESHPTRTTQILSEIRSLSSDIIQIAQQHHEDCLAQGFPSRLRKGMIYPMARLVAVANEFCERVIKNPHFADVSPHDALQQMIILDARRLDPIFFDALMKLFNFAPRDDINKSRR